VGNIPIETRVGNGSHNTVPLNFLLVVEFVTAGHTAGMKMGDPLEVPPDGIDEIPFHQLHMVDVVEEFHVGRIDLLHHPHSPRGFVTHIIRMVHLAVEQLQADGDAMIFGNFLDAI
jgi:hypothetical protein